MKFIVKTSFPLCTLALLLAACGGGGGGGDSGSSSASGTGSSQSSSAPSPSSSSSSSSASSTNVLRAPSLLSPEAGSTAVVGNTTEGIWHDEYGLMAFISPEGKIYQRGNYINLVGTLAFNTGSWQLSSDSLSRNWAASGSGTYTAKSALSGMVTVTSAASSTYALTLSYDANNARAVTQESVAGTWPSVGAVIDKDGNLSAHETTWGNCTYSGTVKLHAPGTNKNLFDFTMDVTDVDGTCTLSAKHYTGLAALLVLSDGAEQLHFLTERPDHSTGMEGYWDR